MNSQARFWSMVLLAAVCLLGPASQAGAVLEYSGLNCWAYSPAEAINELPRHPGTLLEDDVLALLPWLFADDQAIEDMHQLGTFYYEAVTTLEGMQVMVSLQWLELRHLDFTELTPIAELDRLEWVDLTGGVLTALPDLSGMQRLTELVAAGNLLEDLSAFAAPASLWRLDLSGNRLSDISALPAALAAADGLARLDLRGNPLSAEAVTVHIPQLLSEHPGLEVLYDLPGDADGDGAVDLADFIVLKQHYGQSAGRADGDFTGDGLVSIEDFIIMKRFYGMSL